jgi:hypothetical protein
VSYLNNVVYVHTAGPVWLIGWGHPSLDAESIYVPLFSCGSTRSPRSRSPSRSICTAPTSGLVWKARSDELIRAYDMALQP